MDEGLGALTVIASFVLRLGVPVAITIGVVQLFRRLDIRWQTQDWGHWSARLDSTGGEAGRNWLSRLANPCWNENGCEEVGDGQMRSSWSPVHSLLDGAPGCRRRPACEVPGM